MEKLRDFALQQETGCARPRVTLIFVLGANLYEPVATITRLPTSYVTPCQLLRTGFREREMDYLLLPIFVKFKKNVVWKKLGDWNENIQALQGLYINILDG